MYYFIHLRNLIRWTITQFCIIYKRFTKLRVSRTVYDFVFCGPYFLFRLTVFSRARLWTVLGSAYYLCYIWSHRVMRSIMTTSHIRISRSCLFSWLQADRTIVELFILGETFLSWIIRSLFGSAQERVYFVLALVSTVN